MTSSARVSPARRRILDTAARLFYAEGVHSVGIDRIIAEAAVAKATFYHHFPSKDELVCGYLTEHFDLQRAGAESLRRDSPVETLHAIFQTLVKIGCGPGFRGCAFINAAAEYPSPQHPVRQVVAEYLDWFRSLMRSLAAEAGSPDPDQAARMLMVLRDGIAVSASLDSPEALSPVVDSMVDRTLGETVGGGC